jgi:hypothetical protein
MTSEQREKIRRDAPHEGSPCKYCGIPHDDVPVGPCVARRRIEELEGALRELHDECSTCGHDRYGKPELLEVGPMIAPSERVVLKARRALEEANE